MGLNRAYSLLDIKAYDDEARVITGIATTPEPDRYQDVVDPLGAQFRNPLPLLWQHDATKPVGTVVFDNPTESGITFRAELPRIEESGALKDLVDLAWQAVKARLVRGVSIGFRALKHAYLENGGIEFSETEILELSLVTIPANASATIQTIKSIDSSILAVSGTAAATSGTPRRVVTLRKSGVADPKPTAGRAPVMIIPRTRAK